MPMNIGAGAGSAIRWATLITASWLLTSCNALDRARLDHVAPRLPPDDGGQMNLPDGSAPMDSGVRMDSGVPTIDSGVPTIDSSVPTIDSGRPNDAQVEASVDAGDDAATDTGSPMCGVDDFDCCPDDASKLAPGVCGCGVPDVDGDSDDAPDCIDQCPTDPAKTMPGECGCGASETSAADCAALRAALRHRYRFAGTGTVVTDDIADADGTVFNAALDDSSTLTLAGGTSNQYVELPDGIISALTNATFEAWLTWQGGAAWQRVFDFGNATGASGTTYVFVTPQRGSGAGQLRATMSLSSTATEVVVDAAATLPSGARHHIVLVVDDQNDQLRLYLDGVLQNSVANTRALSGLSDANNWLGRSQYSADPELAGTYHEFRIYGQALSDAQVAASFAFGPDPIFLE